MSELKTIEELMQGCGNKVDINGDCAYYSDRGTLRFCSTCLRRIKIIAAERQLGTSNKTRVLILKKVYDTSSVRPSKENN